MRPLVVMLAAALVVGCGGDDDDNLSAEEYREKQNELCVKANREIAELDAPRSPDELADFLEEGLELGQRFDRQARELDPPDELRDLHEQGLRLSDRVNKEFEELIERVRAAQEPFAEFQEGVQGMLGDIQESDALNQRLGLDKCLEVPGLRGSGEGPA